MTHDCTCLGYLEQHDTNRIISISLIWPKQVRKMISGRDFADVIALNSAAVNPAYGSFTLVTLVRVTVSDSNSNT